MTTDTDKLRELCKKATPGPWEFVDDEDSCYSLVCRKGDVSNSIVKSHNEADIDFIAAANPSAILALLDELDRLREQARQHQAFQEWTNQTEELRLNDARREGFKRAQEWAARICWSHDMDAKQNASALGWSGSPAEAIDCVPAIRAMQPPAEWASSEQCGGAPNTEWKHPDGFGGGLMGDRE